MKNTCVMCGCVVTKGMMVCPTCKYTTLSRKDFNMIEVIINIDTVDKVREFCSLCSKCNGEVTVYGGRYIVSGKSLMGLFSLDLSKNLKAEFCGDIPNDVKEGMKKFIID